MSNNEFISCVVVLIYSVNLIESLLYLQIGDGCLPEGRYLKSSSSSSPPVVSFNNFGNSTDGPENSLVLPLLNINYTANGGEDNEETLLREREALATQCDPSLPLECLAGRCNCRKGFTINRNGTKCLEIARNGLDSKCEENIQCWKGLLGRMSECNGDTGKCQCYESETLTIVYHRGRCSYGENLGEYCQIEGLCEATTPNATCRSGGTCQCKEGFVPSWDKSHCLPIATEGLNSTCEENIQCEKSQLGALSECNQDVMKCHCYKIPDMETVFFGGKCYFEAALGDVCQVTAQCQQKTENSICSRDGKCFCDDGYIPNGNSTFCLPIPSSDRAVSEDEQAVTAVETIHLAAAAVATGVNVVPITNNNNNGQCFEDSQCTRLMGPLSRCNLPKQKCECYVAESIHHQFRLYNHHHNNNPQLDNALTSSSQGTPNKNSHLKLLNGSDVEQMDQQPPSWSNYATSSNPVVLVMIGSKCYLGKELGQTCKYNKQCSVLTGNSWCDNGRCECLDETHVRSGDGRKCLKIVQKGLDSVCDEDAQCAKSDLGPLSQCNEEKRHCECKNNVMPVVYYKGRCYFHRQLGSSCETGAECQAGSGHLAECSSGRCRCRNGTVKLTQHLCGINNTKNSAVGNKSSHKMDFLMMLSSFLLVLTFLVGELTNLG